MKKYMSLLKYIALVSFSLLIGCYFFEGNDLDYKKYNSAPTKAERDIDIQNIMQNISYLSLKIGSRPAGSDEANKAASWFKQKLQGLGYTPNIQRFKLPGGNEGQNILCKLEGRTQQVIVIASHLDTVKQSPGANDDASGMAVLIELARLVKQYNIRPENTIVLAAFGAEEEVEGFSGHNYSSLNYLKSLPAETRKNIVGCIYLDKLGVGQKLLIRNIIFTDSQMTEFCLNAARKVIRPGNNFPLKGGWLLSLPMSFEKYGIPAAFIEWAPDPDMHKASDLPGNLVEDKILMVAKIVLHMLLTKRV